MRRFLLGLICCGVTALAADLPKIQLITDWYPQPELGGYYTAQLNGYWKKQGIDVTVIPGGPNAAVAKRVMTETNSVGISRGDSVLLARERGLPLLAVMSYLQHDPQGIMVHDTSPVKTFTDLEGRTVAVPPGASWFVYLSKKYVWKKVKVVSPTGVVANFVVDPNYIQEASPTDEPYYAQKQGAHPRMLQVSDSGFDPYTVVVAPEAWAKAHPDWIKAFARGAYEGWAEFYRNPEATFVELKRQNPNLEMEGMRYGLRVMKEKRFAEGYSEKGEAYGQVRAERWKTLAAELKEVGLLQSESIVKGAFTEEYEPAKVGFEEKFPPAP